MFSRGFLNVRDVLSDSYIHRKVLALLVAVELLLFLVFNTREIAWYPPLSFDQTQYLTEAYGLQEQVLWHGPGKLWSDLLRTGQPTGVGLPIEGAISGLLLVESGCRN
jgi:hypothetical protein